MRQLMVATADCGRALSAWPAWSSVGMQVVRIWPTVNGLSDSALAATASPGLAANAVIALPSAVLSVAPAAFNDAIVVSFHCTGNWYARIFERASTIS